MNKERFVELMKEHRKECYLEVIYETLHKIDNLKELSRLEKEIIFNEIEECCCQLRISNYIRDIFEENKEITEEEIKEQIKKYVEIERNNKE